MVARHRWEGVPARPERRKKMGGRKGKEVWRALYAFSVYMDIICSTLLPAEERAGEHVDKRLLQSNPVVSSPKTLDIHNL